MTTAVEHRIAELCSQFRLPTVSEQLHLRLELADQRAAIPTVVEVLEMEAEARQHRRVARLLAASKLPPGKTFDLFESSRLPSALRKQIDLLSTGEFLADATNVLCFGLPGTGKSHVAAAVGHALVQQGRTVLFTPTFQLVQELLAAKRDLELPRVLRKLDGFELIVLDDIGYVQQSAEEIEVLFTLLAERYERRSLLITSNLVFHEWDQIFKNPMTTAAAIDRLVHHSVILEFSVESYRTDTAKKRQSKVRG